jgi:hypothetical protein
MKCFYVNVAKINLEVVFAHCGCDLITPVLIINTFDCVFDVEMFLTYHGPFCIL